jgi:putative DNA primase/helicase
VRPAQVHADFVDPEPWTQPVAGHALLAELTGIIDKHIVTEDHCTTAVALWTVLTFLVDVVDIMPLLAITSPEKRCGKSRLLTLLLKLVRRPLPGVSVSAATVYRSIEKWHPTLLIDEADGVLKDSRGHDNLELRSVINSGHTRELAYVSRCEGDAHEVKKFSTWSPKAIALIGRMPDSMFDRSIPIPMKRKSKADTVARIRETQPSVFEELRSKIVRFVEDNAAAMASVVPSLPPGLNDRAEDCWLPMFAIADVAGGIWPDLARRAALTLSAETDDSDTFTTKLLRALKKDFEDNGQAHPSGFQSTADICEHLNQDDEAPWANFKKQLTVELLAAKLRPYKLKSERPVIGGQRERGFYRKKLQPVFDRYL